MPDFRARGLALRRKAVHYRWVRRAALTLVRYRQRDGDHYAAAITFFSLLSLVPLLMLAVSVGGFALAGDAELAAHVNRVLAGALPDAAGSQLSGLVDGVVAERGSLGIVALVVAVYSGWSWISHLRDAVTSLLGQHRMPRSLLRTVVNDVLTLLGIGLVLACSFLFAALTGIAGGALLDLLGLADTTGARLVLVIGSLVLGLIANWLVIIWCLAKLPRQPRPLRGVLRPAAVAALGLALLQQAGGLFLYLLGKSPAVATLGAVLGLLVFVYLVVRWLLLVTVWTSTRPETVTSDWVREAGHASATLAVGASAGLTVRTLTGR